MSSLFHSGLITAVFEYPCVTHIFLLLTLNNGFSLFSKVKRLFRNLTQEFALRQSGGKWQGVCKDIGRYLPRFFPPIVLNFTPEQVQDRKNLIECLRVVCPDPDNAGELQLAALCCVLAYAYQTLFNTTQHPQGREEVSESDDQITHAVADPEDTPTMVSLAPIVKRKQWKRKSAPLEREEASPKKEGEREEAGISKAKPSPKQQGDRNKGIRKHPILSHE